MHLKFLTSPLVIFIKRGRHAMKFTVNTKQRVYLSKTKFSILLYRKMLITVHPQEKTILITLYNEKIFHKTFSSNTYKAIKRDINHFLLAVSCELLLTKYYEDAMRIITNNASYLQKLFRDLM